MIVASDTSFKLPSLFLACVCLFGSVQELRCCYRRMQHFRFAMFTSYTSSLLKNLKCWYGWFSGMMTLLLTYIIIVFDIGVLPWSVQMTNYGVLTASRTHKFPCICTNPVYILAVCHHAIDAYVRISCTTDLIRATMCMRSNLLYIPISSESKLRLWLLWGILPIVPMVISYYPYFSSRRYHFTTLKIMTTLLSALTSMFNFTH